MITSAATFAFFMSSSSFPLPLETSPPHAPPCSWKRHPYRRLVYGRVGSARDRDGSRSQARRSRRQRWESSLEGVGEAEESCGREDGVRGAGAGGGGGRAERDIVRALPLHPSQTPTTPECSNPQLQHTCAGLYFYSGSEASSGRIALLSRGQVGV